MYKESSHHASLGFPACDLFSLSRFETCGDARRADSAPKSGQRRVSHNANKERNQSLPPLHLSKIQSQPLSTPRSRFNTARNPLQTQQNRTPKTRKDTSLYAFISRIWASATTPTPPSPPKKLSRRRPKAFVPGDIIEPINH